MAQCRSCGAKIDWVQLKSGKNHPVDPDYVEYEEAEQGDKLVTDGGNIITVDHHVNRPSIKGRMSHFASCPEADDWRKKRA